jgi:hypothetical protein
MANSKAGCHHGAAHNHPFAQVAANKGMTSRTTRPLQSQNAQYGADLPRR